MSVPLCRMNSLWSWHRQEHTQNSFGGSQNVINAWLSGMEKTRTQKFCPWSGHCIGRSLRCCPVWGGNLPTCFWAIVKSSGPCLVVKGQSFSTLFPRVSSFQRKSTFCEVHHCHLSTKQPQEVPWSDLLACDRESREGAQSLFPSTNLLRATNVILTFLVATL